MQNVPEEWLAERSLPTWLKEWRPTGLESEPVREPETKTRELDTRTGIVKALPEQASVRDIQQTVTGMLSAALDQQTAPSTSTASQINGNILSTWFMVYVYAHDAYS